MDNYLILKILEILKQSAIMDNAQATQNQPQEQVRDLGSQSAANQPVEQAADIQVPQNIHTLGHEHDAHGHLSQQLYNRDLKAENIYKEIQSNQSQHHLKQEQEQERIKNIQKQLEEQQNQKQKQLTENQLAPKIEPQIDYERANSLILQQRESKWQKLSEQEPGEVYESTLRPIESSSHPVLPVQPNVKESLSYTNNLPVIEKQRQVQTDQVPQSYVKKIGTASLITAASVGGFMLGKVDKSVIGVSGVLVFVASYLIQK